MLLTNSQIKNTLALKNELNSEKIHYENLFIFYLVLPQPS